MTPLQIELLKYVKELAYEDSPAEHIAVGILEILERDGMKLPHDLKYMTLISGSMATGMINEMLKPYR